MAWLAVDKNGTSFIYDEKPIRYSNYCWDTAYDEDGEPIGGVVLLPNGAVEKLIGRDLTWEDAPVEI